MQQYSDTKAIEEALNLGTAVALQSAYRSEILGLLALLDYIYFNEDIVLTNTASMTIYCDNERVLGVISRWSRDKFTPKAKHADLISALLAVRDKLGITIVVQHVKAHQDDSIPYHLLTPQAQLNVDMDKDAKEIVNIMITCPTVRANTSHHPYSFALCSWRNKPVLQEMHSELYYHITHAKMEQYWIKKKRLTPETITKVDFDALQVAATSTTINRRRFLAKWACEYISTGKNMQQWGLRYEGNCPFCNNPNETTTHILTCRHVDSLAVWNEALHKFTQKTFGNHTCWYLHLAIYSELNTWRHGTNYPSLELYPPLLQIAVIDQRQIGWKNFLEGLISKRWRQYVDLQYQQEGDGRSTSKFITSLLAGLWTCLFDIWEGRNKQLHQTERIKDMEGIPLLKQAITKEWEKGLGRLPASEFSRHLSPPLSTIMKKSEESLKLWFLIVRQGRIVFDPDNVDNDDFSTSKALQQWIGLSYELQDAEAESRLDDAIRNEIKQGLGHLPTSTFASLFQQSMLPIDDSSLRDKITWFQVIRQGRRLYDIEHLNKDEFETMDLYKRWIENYSQ